ncbi:MAG: hypothetical protein ACKOAG_00400 [Candidatus Kapaibacterium sp.]
MPYGSHIWSKIVEIKKKATLTLSGENPLWSDVNSPEKVKEVVVRGDMTLDRDVKQVAIENINVQGDLAVLSNNSLEGVVGTMKIGGDMTFNGAAALETLPEEILVRRHVNISDCASLKSIGQVKAGGDVTILKCPTLEAIADGLEVGGKLVIGECGALQRLPAGLRVRGDVYLDTRAAALGIPVDAVIGGIVIRF